MLKIDFITNKFSNSLIFLGLATIHIVWLLLIKSQMNQDIVFPSWLLANSRNLVSEVLAMYPPLMFYIVVLVNNFAHNLLVSITLIQILLVMTVDALLFYYLKSKFGIKLAIFGLFFYIPWQVFFRGNYLWHDFATIPFVVLSFFSFEKFVSKLDPKYILVASSALALGYLFKLTVIYIYALYFIWIILLGLKKIKIVPLFKNLLFLLVPFMVAVFVNFLLILSRSTFSFTLYWNIIMQVFIYPRLPALSRPITPNYYPVLGLLMTIFVISCYIIQKYSREQDRLKWFLFSFALVSLANIFPRWSDFHVQLFLVPLTIVCASAISLRQRLKNPPKVYFTSALFIICFFSLAIFANRIAIEVKSAKKVDPDYIGKFAPASKVRLISNKRVFIYDYALYDDKLPFDPGKKLNLNEQIILALKNPDKFHHSISWQKSLDYIVTAHPDIILIPYQIKNKINNGKDLTGFEKLLINNYHLVDTVADYFVYEENIAG